MYSELSTTSEFDAFWLSVERFTKKLDPIFCKMLWIAHFRMIPSFTSIESEQDLDAACKEIERVLKKLKKKNSEEIEDIEENSTIYIDEEFCWPFAYRLALKDISKKLKKVENVFLNNSDTVKSSKSCDSPAIRISSVTSTENFGEPAMRAIKSEQINEQTEVTVSNFKTELVELPNYDPLKLEIITIDETPPASPATSETSFQSCNPMSPREYSTPSRLRVYFEGKIEPESPPKTCFEDINETVEHANTETDQKDPLMLLKPDSSLLDDVLPVDQDLLKTMLSELKKLPKRADQNTEIDYNRAIKWRVKKIFGLILHDQKLDLEKVNLRIVKKTIIGLDTCREEFPKCYTVNCPVVGCTCKTTVTCIEMPWHYHLMVSNIVIHARTKHGQQNQQPDKTTDETRPSNVLATMESDIKMEYAMNIPCPEEVFEDLLVEMATPKPPSPKRPRRVGRPRTEYYQVMPKTQKEIDNFDFEASIRFRVKKILTKLKLIRLPSNLSALRMKLTQKDFPKRWIVDCPFETCRTTCNVYSYTNNSGIAFSLYNIERHLKLKHC